MKRVYRFAGVLISLHVIVRTQAEYFDSFPNVTDSGYLKVSKKDGSKIFYSYYESQEEAKESTPILLWLQVSSTWSAASVTYDFKHITQQKKQQLI